jgi:hypothetical protein
LTLKARLSTNSADSGDAKSTKAAGFGCSGVLLRMCADDVLVEAGRIELPSEGTNDRELSCFFLVHFCLVTGT